MSRFLVRLALVTIVLFQYSAAVFAGPLDDYYLQQFGETTHLQLQKAILSAPLEAEESVRCGMPLKHGLQRDWDLLEQTTQKILAKQLAAPALSGEATYKSSAGHFLVHYATIGTDAPPLDDLNSNGIPDWVETVAATFEDVYTSYSSQGYQPAPTRPAGAPYDIYLRDLAPQNFYGVTNSNVSSSSALYPNAVTSWMELDNNFTDLIYRPATFSPLKSLQITAAHEYHHAIQYGYNFYFDVWYAEATSTWMEDELYDGVNQLYNYVPAWFGNSATPLDLAVESDAVATGAGYGRWIFNRFLAEKHGPGVIRSVWERVGGLASPGNNADIPMIPVLDSLLSSATYGASLGSDFMAFAKRVYTRDWTTHTADINRIHVYSPVATFSVYPVNSATSSAPPKIVLPHYSFAYYKFTPASGLNSLTITINKTSGIQTALFKKAGGVTSEIATSASGSSYTVSGFSTADEVVLLIANTSAVDGHEANFSTDGSLVAVSEPTVPLSSASSKGNGCFIATAAYGSYLHPQVQQLRKFRDDYLLTNIPGRAFVALYYRCSPPLADFIALHPVLRFIARLALTPLVTFVAYPLISAVALLLFVGTAMALLHRRVNAERTYSIPQSIHTKSPRI